MKSAGTPRSWDRLTPASLYGPARRRWTPGAAGIAAGNHIALTFDDGPDPVSTPRFLDVLQQAEVRATFFMLGSRVEAHPGVVRAVADAGHEIAVHGWSHRAVPRLDSKALTEDLSRAVEAVWNLSGTQPAWYRPPFGVLTRHSVMAAEAADLTPMLWSAWGREWRRSATHAQVRRTVARRARPGGTVLLHDTDEYARPGCWRATLAATRSLLREWGEAGIEVGTVSEHMPPDPRAHRSPRQPANRSSMCVVPSRPER